MKRLALLRHSLATQALAQDLTPLASPRTLTLENSTTSSARDTFRFSAPSPVDRGCAAHFSEISGPRREVDEPGQGDCSARARPSISFRRFPIQCSRTRSYSP